MLDSNRDLLIKLIKQECIKIIKNETVLENKANILKERHGFELGYAFDLFTWKYSIDFVSDFDLFCMAETFSDIKLNKYFTEVEIKRYTKEKIKRKSSLPFEIKAIEIQPGKQWIGSITIKELMDLRDSQLINYNENTQRILTRTIKNNQEFYTITINRKQVDEIASLFMNDFYIPDDLTLNINEFEKGTDYYYDDDTNTFTVNSIDCFDLIDGYHRYLAASKCSTIDPNFDYKMELRIVNFTEKEARQFIHQKDQKTKMKKVDSEMFNQNNRTVIAVENLNKDCGYLTGKINNKNGLIDSGVLVVAITELFVLGKYKSTGNKMKTYVQIEKEVRDGLNKFISYYPDSLEDKKWNMRYTTCVLYAIAEERISDFEKIYDVAVNNNILNVYSTIRYDIKKLRKLVKDGE